MRNPIWGILALAPLLPAVAAAQADLPPLARFVSRSDVVFYLEHTGTENAGADWDGTEAAKLFSETPTGAMFEAIIAQFVDQLAVGIPNKKFNGADLAIVLKHVGKHGGLIAVRGKGKNSVHAILVARGVGADKEVMGPFARLVTSGFPPDQPPTPIAGPNGKQVIAAGPKDKPSFVWWIEGTDLIILQKESTEGDYAGLIEEVVSGQTSTSASMASSPIRDELFAAKDGFRPLAVGFFDPAQVPKTIFEKKDLDQITGGKLQRIDVRWGVQDNALVTSLTLVGQPPFGGYLSLLDQPTFGKDGLPKFPAGLTDFTVVSFDAAKTFDLIGQLAAASGPQAAEAWKRVSETAQGRRGPKLKEDFLAQLGPKAAFYVAPGGPPPLANAAGRASNPLAAAIGMLANPPRVCAIAEVKDPKAFSANLEGMIDSLNDGLRDAITASGLGGDPLKALAGRPAPDFQLTVLEPNNGTKALTKKDLAGKVAVIEFWSTQDPKHRENLGEIQKLIRAHERSSKPLAVLAVSQDAGGDDAAIRAQVERAVQESGLRAAQGGKVGAVAVDPQLRAGMAFRSVGNSAVILIDAKGTVRAAHAGTETDLRKKVAEEVDRLLAGRSLQSEGRSAQAPTPSIAFRKSSNTGQPTYLLSIPAGILPIPLPPTVAPAIVMGKKHIAFGLNAKVARDALAAADGDASEVWDPGSDFGPVVNRLPEGMILLQVSDPRGTLPDGLAKLPEAIEQMAAETQKRGVATRPQNLAEVAAGRPAAAGPAGSSGYGSSSSYPGQSGSGPGSRSPGAFASPPGASAPPPGSSGSPGAPSQPGSPGSKDVASVSLKFQIAEGQRPTPEQIRAHLFPASRTLAVVPGGIEYRQRQAFPEIGSPYTFETMLLEASVVQAVVQAIKRATIAGEKGEPAPGANPSATTSPMPGGPPGASSPGAPAPGGAPRPAGSSRRD